MLNEALALALGIGYVLFKSEFKSILDVVKIDANYNAIAKTSKLVIIIYLRHKHWITFTISTNYISIKVEKQMQVSDGRFSKQFYYNFT